MKIKKLEILWMLEQLDNIREQAEILEEKYKPYLEKVHPSFKESALNLLHYRALRQNDIRELQEKLAHLGLSRLGKAEAHVMASIDIIKRVLESFIKKKKLKSVKSRISIKKGNKYLNRNTKNLLGYRTKGRRVRIMVTQPSEAAQHPDLVRKFVELGMNSARVNCAHDSEVEWAQMIENVREASAKVRRKCKVCMDLGGPKIRTGEILPGPKVIKCQPERDDYGRVINPAQIWLIPEGHDLPEETENFILVNEEWLKNLEENDKVVFTDTRNKKRQLKIVGTSGLWKLANCYDAAYIETGTLLFLEKNDEVSETQVGELPPIQQKILLNIGDLFIIHKEKIPGKPAEFDEDGNLLKNAHISCTSEEVFDFVKEGERILFDDGKIEGIIHQANAEKLVVKITYAKEGGAKLKADKGINLPDSDLKISGLTAKDKSDLPFVAEHADVVNLSFVNSKADVEELIAELEKLNAKDKLGIILKIETQAGFNNLTEILLTAMQFYPLGVMIARGDLAIECGWENMARIQEEILSLCQAAHVPVVWATQVLESLAKKGLPSRAEISDAAMSQRAECVMLNKGAHIVDAIKMLNHILSMMKDYQNKKSPMLAELILGAGNNSSGV
ncbi:pyruvate kinase [Flexithrix dorotheae]|uniref:pyruvate kinase n=1 Tax=Flexithrix dorotheae TaxID=70993 RepID=UPI00037E0E1E|nr:pyruvate kinase [Flexithrix dorotheae]